MSFSKFNFQVDEYKQALVTAQPTEKEIELLRALYDSPNHTATPTELALKVGSKHFNTFNTRMGRLAQRVAEALTRYPERYYVKYLFTFPQEKPELIVVMRPNLARALEELGIVRVKKLPPLVEFVSPDEVRPVESFREGSARQISVNAYERSPEARSTCIGHYGTQCTVCGFNFSEKYGDIGDGYIHVHHLKPIASIGEEYKVDPIKDLRPVCPNCHAMLHQKTPPYTIEELQNIIKQVKTRRSG